MLTSFNLFEIVFRPMVNKGMARGVSAILQRAPGAKDFWVGGLRAGRMAPLKAMEKEYDNSR